MTKVCNVLPDTVWKWHLFNALQLPLLQCGDWNNSFPPVFSSPPVQSSASATEPDFKSKDWVFLNYTYKRFEGLTQRGTIPTYMKAGKAWRGTRPCRSGEPNTDIFTDTGFRPPTAAGGARWCWRRRRQPLSINLTLITSYLGPLSCRRCRRRRRENRHKLGKEGRSEVTALPRVVYIVSTCCL